MDRRGGRKGLAVAGLPQRYSRLPSHASATASRSGLHTQPPFGSTWEFRFCAIFRVAPDPRCGYILASPDGRLPNAIHTLPSRVAAEDPTKPPDTTQPRCGWPLRALPPRASGAGQPPRAYAEHALPTRKWFVNRVTPSLRDIPASRCCIRPSQGCTVGGVQDGSCPPRHPPPSRVAGSRPSLYPTRPEPQCGWPPRAPNPLGVASKQASRRGSRRRRAHPRAQSSNRARVNLQRLAGLSDCDRGNHPHSCRPLGKGRREAAERDGCEGFRGGEHLAPAARFSIPAHPSHSDPTCRTARTLGASGPPSADRSRVASRRAADQRTDGHLSHTSRSTRGTWAGRCNPANGSTQGASRFPPPGNRRSPVLLPFC